jgi:hypothetical protein
VSGARRPRRNREHYSEAVLACTHAPIVPIVDESSGETICWRCSCGKTVQAKEAAG